MKIEVNDLLKHSFVISIDDERHQQFKMLFEAENLLPVPQLYEGFKVSGVPYNGLDNDRFQNRGVVNLLYTNIAIVKLAKYLDWPYVGIFEDDAYPCKDCHGHLKDALESIPDNCSILVLGWSSLHGQNNASMKYVNIHSLWGSQANIIFKSTYNEFINKVEERHMAVDDYIGSLDNVYATSKLIFAQYNAKTSEISKCSGYIYDPNMYVSDNDFFKDFYSIDKYIIDHDKDKNVVVFNYFISKKYNSTINIMQWFYNMKSHFLSRCNRKFVIFTDNKDTMSIIDDPSVEWHIVDESCTEDITVNLMSKFNYMKQWLDSCSYIDTIQYIAYVQSNARCSSTIDLYSIIRSDDAAIVLHSDFASKKKTFIELNCGDNRGTNADITGIDCSNFKYVNAGLFVFTTQLFQNVCRSISTMASEDIARKSYPTWHDESYFNYIVNTQLEGKFSINYLDGNIYAHSFYSIQNVCPKISLLTKQDFNQPGDVKHLNIDDAFHNSYVITIDDEKCSKFYRRLKSHGISTMPQKMLGCCMKNTSSEYWKQNISQINNLMTSTFGACTSHRTAVCIAKALDMPFVMVFEDDALPINHLDKYMRICLDQIPQDADVVVLGWIRCQDINIDSECRPTPCYRRFSSNPGNFAGAQCYIVFKNAYDKYLQTFNNDECMIDRIWFFNMNSYISQINMFAQIDNNDNVIWYESGKSATNLEHEYLESR